MKHTLLYPLIALFIVSISIILIRFHLQPQRQARVDELIRQAERYSGATGDTIKKFDNKIDRWIEEMKSEPVEIIVQKLTDAAEHMETQIFGGLYNTGVSIDTDEDRNATLYSQDIRALLGNRRFRKAYEDLQNMDKVEAATLLTKNIKKNVTELRLVFQKCQEAVSQGPIKGNMAMTVSIPDSRSYRYSSNLDYPPTPLGRRYAVLSYIMLASLLELQAVRPAIEEVIALAKDEYKLFNSINKNESGAFSAMFLSNSLYNPSLLLTATLCDPEWNADYHKLIASKMDEQEIVDWQARSTEYDMPGREGWVPVKPHDKMLKIRYYKGITDEEFNTFFAK